MTGFTVPLFCNEIRGYFCHENNIMCIKGEYGLPVIEEKCSGIPAIHSRGGI